MRTQWCRFIEYKFLFFNRISKTCDYVFDEDAFELFMLAKELIHSNRWTYVYESHSVQGSALTLFLNNIEIINYRQFHDDTSTRVFRYIHARILIASTFFLSTIKNLEIVTRSSFDWLLNEEHNNKLPCKGKRDCDFPLHKKQISCLRTKSFIVQFLFMLWSISTRYHTCQ